MEHLDFSFQHVIDGNGIGIAITGMVIVYVALTIISLFIATLPKILPFLDKVVPEASHHHGAPKKQQADDTELVAAIGYAFFKMKNSNKNQALSEE